MLLLQPGAGPSRRRATRAAAQCAHGLSLASIRQLFLRLSRRSSSGVTWQGDSSCAGRGLSRHGSGANALRHAQAQVLHGRSHGT